MKKSTTVEVTYSSYSGDIYIADDKTFSWLSAKICYSLAERHAFSYVLDCLGDCRTPLRVLVTEADLKSPSNLIAAVVVLVGVAAGREQHLAVVDSLNPNSHMGRYKATSIRNLMRLEIVAGPDDLDSLLRDWPN